MNGRQRIERARRPTAARPCASCVRKRSFSGVRGTDQADRDRRRRLGAAVAGGLLHLAQLAPQPQLVAGAVEDQHAVAGARGSPRGTRESPLRRPRRSAGSLRGRSSKSASAHGVRWRCASRWSAMRYEPRRRAVRRTCGGERLRRRCGGDLRLLQPVLHQRPQILEDVSSRSASSAIRGSSRSRSITWLLPLVVHLQSFRNPEQPRETALSRALGRELVLDLDERLRRRPPARGRSSCRSDGSTCGSAPGRRGSAARASSATCGSGRSGSTRVALLLQIALAALRAARAGRSSSRRDTRRRRSPPLLSMDARLRPQRGRRAPDCGVSLSSASSSSHDVVREIVELEPEVALRLGAEHLVELADLAGFGIDLEELVAEQAAAARRASCRAAPASSAP